METIEVVHKRMMGEKQNKRKMMRQKQELAAKLKTKRKKKKRSSQQEDLRQTKRNMKDTDLFKTNYFAVLEEDTCDMVINMSVDL